MRPDRAVRRGGGSRARMVRLAAREALVLIDGYRRVAALRRLGRDTASVEQWSCDLTAGAAAGGGARAGSCVRQHRGGACCCATWWASTDLSQHEVARRCGRDVSWVSRRLQLLSGLPDAALAAVRGGKLSSWAANRVVVPLARANAGPCRASAGDAGHDTAVDARVAVLVRALPADPANAPASAWSSRPRLFIDTLRATDGVARRRTPAGRPRRRMHRRSALPRGGDRAAAQACRHAAPAADRR